MRGSLAKSRRRPPGLWLAVLFLSSLAEPPAFSEPLVFEPLGRHQGLDAQVAVSLLMDDGGFFWVGSREGLYR